MYRNEEAVGRAIRDSGLPREAVFVTSKLAPKEQVCVRSFQVVSSPVLDGLLLANQDSQSSRPRPPSALLLTIGRGQGVHGNVRVGGSAGAGLHRNSIRTLPIETTMYMRLINVPTASLTGPEGGPHHLGIDARRGRR